MNLVPVEVVTKTGSLSTLSLSQTVSIVLNQMGHLDPSQGPPQLGVSLKGKCALGPFLSILVIECKHKGLNVKICSWMNKV
jgi:hypothetical protein